MRTAPISDQATLYEIRVGKDMKHDEVARAVSVFLRLPKTLHWTAIAQIEDRGTNKADIIEALAAVYNATEAEIKQAARNSKERGRPENVRRRRTRSG